VKSKGQIGYRKIIAAIFFAALAFVYAEKVMHKHECPLVETNQASVSKNLEYTTCTLCDFQPVTAAEVPVIAECEVPVKFIFHKFIPESDNYFYQSLVLINGRGPPRFS